MCACEKVEFLCDRQPSWNTIHTCSFTHTTAAVHWRRSSNNNDFRSPSRLSYSLWFSISTVCEKHHISPSFFSSDSVLTLDQHCHGADRYDWVPCEASFPHLRWLALRHPDRFTCKKWHHFSQRITGIVRTIRWGETLKLFKEPTLAASWFLGTRYPLSISGKRSLWCPVNLTQNQTKTSWGIKGPLSFR